MAIWLTFDRHSGVPIYLQLVQQFQHALEVGTLQPGEQLPTVRQLAGDLTIAPNTIVKTYNELQSMGLIESRTGAGTVVVAQSNGTIRRQQIATLYERLALLVHDAAGLGVAPADLADRFQAEVARFYKESEGQA